MDAQQVVRDANGVMRCRECGFVYALSPDQIAERAGTGYDAVAAAVASVPEEYRAQRPAPRVWSVNAYTSHLADAAEVIHRRIVAIAEQDLPLLPNHDENEAVERTRADERPAEESLARLQHHVAAFRDTILALPLDAWDRAGMHSIVGEVRLREIAHDMPHELHHHAGDVRVVGGQVRAAGEAASD